MTRGPIAALLCLMLELCAVAARAGAQECSTAPIKPASDKAEQVFQEARVYAANGHYEQARAMYAWLLARSPDDHDAQLAIARLDAWQRCYAQAERRFQKLLREDPADVEARTALVDVYLWTDRRDEAEALVAQGQQLDKEAAPLWFRRARLSLWYGDRTRAIDEVEHALELAPEDSDARDFRESLYHGQARLSGRVDLYPGLPDLYTGVLQLVQHVHQVEFIYETLVSSRGGGAGQDTLVDGRHWLTMLAHFRAGRVLGVGLGFGGPVASVPSVELRLFAQSPLFTAVLGSVGYGFWHYESGRDLHILSPSITVDVIDTVSVDLRLWSTLMFLPPPKETFATIGYAWINAAGIRVMWRPRADLMLGVGYAYGPQIDQSQFNYDLLTTMSHTFSAFGDWRIVHWFGVQPLLTFERRQTEARPALGIWGAELAFYVRW